MGLDQYVTKKTFIWGKQREALEINEVEGLEHIDPKKISYIEEEIGYWRKANHIHNWFVNNIQEGKDDCGEYEISEDQLLELFAAVTNVQLDHSLAKTLLPTTEGFFFGGTEYDDYYLESLKDTEVIICNALKAIKAGSRVYYSSSW